MLTDISEHPLASHYLTVLRNKETCSEDFRRASDCMTRLLIAEASRILEVDTFTVETPLEVTQGAAIKAGVVVVPILRAGLGMLDAALEILPSASVGYIGLERDEETAIASCYYSKFPELTDVQRVFVIDPMLATGGSARDAISQIKKLGANKVTMVCIVAAPEGIKLLNDAFPEVDVIAGVVDRQLDTRKYILPGLGDFGDRLFAT
ncbi:MAG: uracil phosphoribosyltransferase [Verrucomicrobiota bacterium]